MDVPIRFVADLSSLGQAFSELGKLAGLADEELAAFEQANVAFMQQKTLIAQTQGPMDKLAQSAKKVPENLANGSTNKIIEELKKQISDLTAKVDELSKKNESGGQKSNNVFRQMKQQYNELVASATEAYNAGNKALGDELIAKAGQLQDKIGDLRATTKAYASDTAALDSLTQGITAIGAGFQIAQGAQVLFGHGHEDLQKTLVKVQATMALVNGLTTIQNALQKESALRIGITNGLRAAENALARIGITFKTVEVTTKQADNAAGTAGEVITKRRIVVQAIENALTSESAIVRGIATAAQWALNAAMDAFPLFAIIAAVVAAIAIFAAFGDSAEDLAEKQGRLNQMELDYIEAVKATNNYLNSKAKDREAQMQAEIDHMKAQGASADDVRQKEIELAQERLKNATVIAARQKQDIDNLEANRKKVEQLQYTYANLNNLKNSQNTDDYDKRIDKIKQEIDLAKGLVELGQSARDNLAQAQQDLQNKQIEQQRALEEEALKSRKASIEAKLKYAKQGSDAQFALEKALAQATYDLEMNNANLTAGEKEKIYADYIEKIRQIDENYQRTRLQDQLAGINAQLAAARRGSQTEYELKLKAMQVQRDIDLTNSKLTEAQKQQIVAESLRKQNDLTADFQRKQTLDQLNAQKLMIDAKMQLVEKGSEDEYKLKQQQLLIQQQIELSSIDKDVENTELGEAKKAEITAKYIAMREQLEQNHTQVIIQQHNQRYQQESDYLSQMAQLEANSINTSFERRQQLELAQLQSKRNNLEYQKLIEQQNYADGAITYAEYMNRLTDIARQQALTDLEITETTERQKYELRERYADKFGEITTKTLQLVSDFEKTMSDNRLQKYDEELAALQEQKDKQLITEDQYNSRKKVIDDKIKAEKRAAAIKEKQYQIMQIEIETAVAAMKALGTPPAPNFPLAVVTEIFGQAQALLVKSKDIPQFYKGTEAAPPGWAWVGERGPELMYMRGGEKIKTADESNRMMQSWRAMRDSQLAVSLNTLHDEMPYINRDMVERALKVSHDGTHFDIDKLGEIISQRIGEQISNLPLTMFSFDKYGFRASVHEGKAETNYVNDRYGA